MAQHNRNQNDSSTSSTHNLKFITAVIDFGAALLLLAAVIMEHFMR